MGKNALQQKAVSSTSAQSSLSRSQPCRISQVFCLAYAVLHAACYLPPLLLRSPEAWIRACSTMSSCSSSTNKSSRRWTLDCPCCAEPVQRPGSPGSWTSAACASPSAPIPWAARQKEKGKSKTCVFIFIFYYSFCFCYKSLTKNYWKPQLQKNQGAKCLGFLLFPTEAARCWVLWKIHTFHWSAVMEGKGPMSSAHKWEYKWK